MTTQEELSEEVHLAAWAGTRDDLRRLGQVISEQFTEPSVRLAPPNGAIRKLAKRILRRRRDRDHIMRYDEVQLEVKDARNRAHSAVYDDLLDDERLDLRNIQEVNFTCYSFSSEHPARRCFLWMSKRGLGIRLSVAGDSRWAPAAVRAISDELHRNKPWWAFMRRPVVATLSALAIGLPILLVMLAAVDTLDSKGGAYETISTVGAFMAAPLVTAAVFGILKAASTHIFPAVELLEPGGRSGRQRASRALSIAAGVFLGLVSLGQGVAWILEHM